MFALVEHATGVVSVDVPRAHAGYDTQKRLIDVTLAVVLLVALAPVLFVIAVLVRLTSTGPALFVHTRCGQYGRPIRVYKFRTMCVDAEARIEEVRLLAHSTGLHVVDGPAFKSAKDPRVTPVGRVLRRFSLDELPQLLNVLGGSMSLVGPRPLVYDEVATLTQEQMVRQAVKPGVTCTWQVSGRSNMAFAPRMELDVDYVRQRSTALDLALIARTPVAALKADGAY
jgi:lipopolysaccharide/colanic/teichoic acid biosynthesis glycosyltransferase